MFEFIFWKVFLKGKVFIFIRVPLITVAVVVIIMGGVMAVIMVVGVVAAVVMTPGKGFGKNPKKSSPRKKGEFPLGLLMQKGV